MPLASRRKILVVDDCHDTIRMLADLLALRGHVAHGLTEPTELFCSVDEFSPDLVMLDLSMPKLDAFQAAAELRLRGFSNPVVAVTGYSATGLRERALALGFDDFLLKPVQMADIEKMLSRMLPGRYRMRGNVTAATG